MVLRHIHFMYLSIDFRSRLARSSYACICSLFLTLSLFAGKQTPSEEVHQNVVLILIDDLSHYGVTAYGADRMNSNHGLFENAKISTPRIDRLAQEGMLCDHAYTYPLCESTRIALMSGQTNNRNYLDCKAQHESEITFGDAFQRAGYTTGIFGKWKQTRGSNETPAKDYISKFGWDEYACFDVVEEGQRFINPNLVINGVVTDYTGRTDLDPETGRRWYGPDICNRYALDFIEDHKEKPFFLYYSMMLVHDDHKPTPDTLPRKLYDEFDEAPHNHNGHTGDDQSYFPAMLSYTDKLIGNVVDQIDALGLSENTLIIVMGDNGTKEAFSHVLADGTIYPGRKGGNADNGIHVPLVLRQPGTIPAKKEGETVRHYNGLIHLTDIYPTIAEAAGVDIPNLDTIDGISFWAQAKGTTEEHRDVIHAWYNANNPYTSKDTVIEYAFDKNFKRYAPSKRFPEGRFFDLRTDLLERVGDQVEELKWGILQYSGLQIEGLAEEQKEAYNRLGEVLEKNKLVAVEGLKIKAPTSKIVTGETYQLHCDISPSNATRRNVIWESSDPAVLHVNKFGEVTALAKGTATIRIFSWDDARPLSKNLEETYLKTGINDELTFVVK